MSDPEAAGRGPPREWLARPTPLTEAFIALIAGVHLVIAFLAMGGRPPGAWDLLLSIDGVVLEAFGATTPDLIERGEPWRLVTSALLHANLIHLGMNSAVLWNLGRFAERLFGARALALALVAGAAAASAASALHGEKAVGASGAILAVAGFLVTALRGPALHPGAVRAIRLQLILSVGVLVLGGIAANRALAQAEVPIAISNVGHMGGFAAGLLVGALAPAPLVEAAPARARLFRRLSIVAIAGAAALLATGVASSARDLARREGGSIRARLVAGEPLRRVELRDLGLEVSLPATWRDLGSKGEHAVFGPAQGAPFFQAFAAGLEGSFGSPLLGGPDALVAILRERVREQGATDFVAAPFDRLTVAGRPAVRVEVRYEQSYGTDIQEIWYVVRPPPGARGERSHALVFMGAGRDAEIYAERVLGTVRFLRP